MSYESRAYDNEHGDPVVVLVTMGTHDVSRLVNLLAGSRMALCEHVGLSGQILRQVKRHDGGRAALKLLVAHGGPDLTAERPTVDGQQLAEVVEHFFRKLGFAAPETVPDRLEMFREQLLGLATGGAE